MFGKNPEAQEGDEMKERPIIFSTEMVQAIMAGAKTQTRRVMKPQPKCKYHNVYLDSYNKTNEWVWWGKDNRIYGTDSYFAKHSIGDLLYVRETFARIDNSGFELGDMPEKYIEYKADTPKAKYPGGWDEDTIKELHPDDPRPVWSPSIHMPKAYARIWLKVLDVRVERLQDISEEDAIKEGMFDIIFWSKDLPEYGFPIRDVSMPIANFRRLWDKINGKKYPWADNCWVWVYEFEKVER